MATRHAAEYRLHRATILVAVAVGPDPTHNSRPRSTEKATPLPLTPPPEDALLVGPIWPALKITRDPVGKGIEPVEKVVECRIGAAVLAAHAVAAEWPTP